MLSTFNCKAIVAIYRVLEWQEVALPEPSALRSQLRGHRRQRRITTAYGLHYFRTGLG